MRTQRQTQTWTPTLVEAFGPSGEKGRKGELFVKRAIESWGWQVRDNEGNILEQLSGRDLWIKKPEWSNFYSIDVKNNLNEYGAFTVVPKEWMNPAKKNDRFWHVNTETGWMAWYSREDMQRFIGTTNRVRSFTVGIKDQLPFKITRARFNVPF
jgi:hypothetical protein